MHVRKLRVNTTYSEGLDAFFGENELLIPVTPNDHWWIFRNMTFVEGVKLMHMHKSRIDAKYSEGLDAILVKITFLTPVTPSWHLTPSLSVPE